MYMKECTCPKTVSLKDVFFSKHESSCPVVQSLKDGIKEMAGVCHYCEKDNIRWFCPECYWGICNDCLEEDTWANKCQRCLRLAGIPELADINLF